MNIDYYRNYIMIIEEGSMSAASLKAHVAQPALSNQLKLLEKEFGCELMIRDGKKLKPTEAGLILYEKCKDICGNEELAQKQIHAYLSGVHGVLRLGIPRFLPDPLLTSLLQEFSRAYPGITYEMHEFSSSIIYEMLQDNQIDIGVVSSPIMEINMNYSPAMKAFAAVVFPRENAWLSPDLPEIPIAMLKNVPIAFTKGIDGRFTKACASDKFVPNKFAACSSRSGALLWVEAKKAAAVFITSDIEQFESESMCCRKLVGHDLIVQRYFVHMTDRHLSPTGSSFWDFVNNRLEGSG